MSESLFDRSNSSPGCDGDRQLKRGDLSLTTIENNLSQLRRRMDAMKQQAMATDGLAKDRERTIEELKSEVEHGAKLLVEEVSLV